MMEGKSQNLNNNRGQMTFTFFFFLFLFHFSFSFFFSFFFFVFMGAHCVKVEKAYNTPTPQDIYISLRRPIVGGELPAPTNATRSSTSLDFRRHKRLFFPWTQ